MSDVVQMAVENGIATVTMNRPDSMNALNPALSEALIETLGRVEDDDGVRCVVLNGAGPAFMAGGDIKHFHGWIDQPAQQRKANMHAMIHGMHPVVIILRRMPKPVIASVHGAAAGFGVSLMLACDLALAAEDTVFTLAYIRLGTSPDGSSTYTLPRVVGTKRAMELALLGDRFNAQRALELGLVNRVVAPDALGSESAALAARLAAGPTKAYAQTKALINRSLQSGYEDQLQAELEAFGECATSDDFREGVKAFVEKRPPKFTGS